MFCSIQCNTYVYVKNNQEGISVILVWVDKAIAVASCSLMIVNIKGKLRDSFNVKGLDETSSILGIQFERRNDVIKMSQSFIEIWHGELETRSNSIRILLQRWSKQWRNQQNIEKGG